MKRAMLNVLVLTVAVGSLLVWRRATAQETTLPAGTTQPAVATPSPAQPATDLQTLKKDLEALKADLAKLTDEKKALADELDKFKTAFKRHTHPVLMWDATKRGSSPWPWNPGSFFVAYPKVGTGDTDADAMAAAGTWGKP